MSTELALIHGISGCKDGDEAMCNLWKASLKRGSSVFQQRGRDVKTAGNEAADIPHSTQAAILLATEHKQDDSLVEDLEL